MAASWDPNSITIHAKSVSRETFPGSSTIFKNVQQSATTIPPWLHHGIQGLPYGKVSSATSTVSQGVRQPVSNNTMHSFPFFHDSLYEYGYCVTMESQETQLSEQPIRLKSPVPGHRSNSKKLRSNHAKT